MSIIPCCFGKRGIFSQLNVNADDPLLFNSFVTQVPTPLLPNRCDLSRNSSAILPLSKTIIFVYNNAV